MVKKYIVDLSAEERAYLEQFTTTGRRAADRITRARILLKADCNQPDGSWSDQAIATALDVGVRTVERVRCRFVELGRRIAEFETLQTEVAAWVETRNQQQTWIDWRFTTEEARTKLKRLYPSIND